MSKSILNMEFEHYVSELKDIYTERGGNLQLNEAANQNEIDKFEDEIGFQIASSLKKV